MAIYTNYVVQNILIFWILKPLTKYINVFYFDI